MVSQDVKGRIRFFDWRREEDYLKILCLADILIDTFPSGGGAILFDAMALGIPVVSFKNNYLRRFDQTDWSVAEEIVGIPEMMVPRRDFTHFKAVISRLIEDKDYRQGMSERCRNDTHERRGNPRQTVQRCEEDLPQADRRETGAECFCVSGPRNASEGNGKDCGKIMASLFQSERIDDEDRRIRDLSRGIPIF